MDNRVPSPAPVSAATPSASIPDAVRRATYIIIAAYHEQSAIGEVVRELVVDFPNVVVIDDGSADATGREALVAGATVLTHFVNRGQGAALQTGIDFALSRAAQYIVTFDADGQHRPSDLPKLLAPIIGGDADIVLGSRFIESADAVPPGRRAVLFAAVLFTRLTSRVKLSDTHNGLRAFSRRAAESIDLQLDRMAHASELIDQVRASGLAYTEVPVEIRYTSYSMAKGQRSSAAIRIALDYLIGKLLR
ncbi:MAG: glycosyltransferase family 2 protein [Myxococcales bacterium]|nr:glycosyltransferase family 2 protein [Myxococcales bacterium]